MNIILLSGGSGTRLWPLSNEVRSKQFVKFFKNDKGEEESMVQRVYRQIKSVDPEARITIATSKVQRSAIRNQLGENVSISIEPGRRDTFPAIALSCEYLHDELGVSEDEVVVVLPVDPYVDESYFERVKLLVEKASMGTSNLYLMGIEPTEPSSKYGYIIPKEKAELSKVVSFKEKPDEETAKKYIAQGALWNAGIFAFKLSYLLKIAKERTGFGSYQGLFAHYNDQEKISFDYAVAEHEQNIEVLRFAGKWIDVGTWNAIADVMESDTKGRVLMDETCSNTKVLNELDIPLLVVGAKNLIVAASPDGILVSEKEHSSEIKELVEEIEDPARYVEKSWGEYQTIAADPKYLVAIVNLPKGHQMSYHCHELRDETWTVLNGTGKVTIEGKESELKPGDALRLPAGIKHTIFAESDLTLLESQIGETIDVHDKKKYPLKRGEWEK